MKSTIVPYRNVHLFLLVFFLFVLVGCDKPEQSAASQSPEQSAPQMQQQEQPVTVEEITYTTKDDMVIAGTYYHSDGQDAVILLHMLGKDRSSWEKVPEVLQHEGFAVLAIDLRGHGKSIKDNFGFSTFGLSEFQHMVYVVEGAKRFIRKRGLTGDISIVGASIGAN